VPLTSATHPEAEIADAVLRLLTERLAGSQQAMRKVTVRSHLVERKSVTAPRS